MAQGDFTRINTNIGALNALNSLKNINTQMGVRQLRLATGKRINEAAEDPAGLTIATKFRYRSSGLGAALDNIGDAKNLMAVAEGGLTKINDILVQIRDKTLQAANDALGADERTAIDSQIKSYLTQIDNIVDETQWNGGKLIAGGTSKVFQTGADASETTTFALSQNFKSAQYLGIDLGSTARNAVAVGNAVVASVAASAPTGTNLETNSGAYTVSFETTTNTFQVLDSGGNAVAIASSNDGSGALTTAARAVTNSGTWNTGIGFTLTFGAGAQAAADNTTSVTFTAQAGGVNSNTSANAYLSHVNDAISKVSKAISNIGALSARLTFKEETLSVAKVNTEAAHNRIMNADMAYEQLESTKLGILQQTATAMLSQANQGPQSILSLFR